MQTIQDINISRRNYLNENGNSENANSNNDDSQKEGIIYRCEIEPNLKPPKLNYQFAKKGDIINYSNEIIIYNAKIKLLSQIKGQKVSEDKSSPWNYDVNLEYILRKEKEDQRKLYNKINEKEKEIKSSEKSFQHLSLISNNYSPTFLTNLKNGDKKNFGQIIKEKLRVINLSNVKKAIIKNDEQEINKYIEKHKFPNNKKMLTLNDAEMETKENNKMKFKIKLKEDLNKLSQKNINKIINRKLLFKSENKTQEKLVYNTLDNSNDNMRSDNKINLKERKITLTKSSKFIPFKKSEFNDVRFLHCKNEFDEKINEMVNSLQLIIEKNPKIIFKLPKLNTNY